MSDVAQEAALAHSLYTLKGVSFRIQNRHIIENMDLTLEEGRIHGLIGPNGSGKSTLIKMLARQQKPSSGSISFLGQDIETLSQRGFARKLAYLPQFMPGTDGMNVEEFVALGRYPWHGTFGRFTAWDQAKVDEAMQQTDVEPFRLRLVDSLSGGERQRVWLAMLLAQDPACLVLDEPTSALDVSHQAAMLDLMKALARRHNWSVAIVLHDINMAARICDRMVALGDGRIVADGAPKEIMTPDILRRIYGVDMKVIMDSESHLPVAYVK